MLNLVRKLLGRQYHFLNTIELSQTNLVHNYHYLSSLSKDLKIAPVLKSNAYGHGLTQIGQILESLNPPFLCVDSLHEAYQLFKNKIKTPILIMGYLDPRNLRVKKLPFSYAVYDISQIEWIHKYQPQAGVHLKIDTGMHRLGIPIVELEDFLKQLNKFPKIKVEGLMSHLAATESENNPLFKLQVKNFKTAKEILKQYQIYPKWFHLSASEPLLNPKMLKEISKISNLARAGKATYGIPLHSKDLNLKPVLTLKSKIAQIKNLKSGDRVGYDGTYTAKTNQVMAVLPIGYFDGVDRRLSNKGFVEVDGIFCPIIGRVSMNITTIDITQVKDPFVGQEVVIYSSNPIDKNSILNTAKLCDTIAHEILIHLASSTTRVIVE